MWSVKGNEYRERRKWGHSDPEQGVSIIRDRGRGGSVERGDSAAVQYFEILAPSVV